jgi:lysophospholipase L1-like esterase
MEYWKKWLHGLCVLMLATGLALQPGCSDDDNDDDSSSSDFGDNNPSVIVAMGDCISGDINYPGVEPYPAILAGMLPSKTIINESGGAAKSSDGASRVNGVLNKNTPAYLLILYGTNDILHSLGHDSIINNLRFIVQAAKNNKTVPIIGTLPPMTHSHSIYNGSIDALNTKIRQMASEENVRVADLAREFAGCDPEMFPDGRHPNADGQAIIAMAYKEKI